jgi:FKBP-type peptidyl-prolyl cis-trans isomerase
MGKEKRVKKLLTAAAVLAMALFVSSCGGGGTTVTSLDTEEMQASYAYGMDVATSMLRAGMDLDVDAFVQGFRDTLEGRTPLLSGPERMQIMQQYAAKMREEQMARAEAAASENLAAGDAFLAENKEKEGVVTTSTGLQYIILEEGTGKRPKADSTVKVNYIGTLIDGTKFDSSYDRGEPVEFPLSGVIPAWTEGVQLIKEGGKIRLFAPPALAYRDRGAPPVIGPNETLIFDIELLEVVK